MKIEKEAAEILNRWFEPSQEVTAQHVLYNDFVSEYGGSLSKFVMYILFQQGWGNPTGKAECGSLGYHKKVVLNK